MKQFDKHADAYDAIRRKIQYPEELYQFLLAKTPGRAAALDMGCGNGVSTIRLAPHFAYVEGIDHGANLIDKATANYPALRFATVAAESYASERRFDLITSATSFYWMDRSKVLEIIKRQLVGGGLFCAYKYDVPQAYGDLRLLIEEELVNKWGKFRDPRLLQYDDTLERIAQIGGFKEAKRKIFSNIIELTPFELALFLLSTSYVTAYMDQKPEENYADYLLDKMQTVGGSDPVKVNFDIYAYIAEKA
ncbi:class I SAM-dependent methyltransferase [Chromobacterium vaccinii]|uniref:class I SAM-dependent methyltransferase n=1 Tax=Chromobacterium vaccinii TaxID=1108595 RepID=UPI001E60A282|nr:methyltransferase domain-containing protein [Chromobacterium vaccinii]MCD4501910.1 methyltransferase domain-containing protein [Chromobacterium vaccinii]